MKLQVEMSEGEFERFREYRAGRKEEDKEGQELAGELRRLSRVILRALEHKPGGVAIANEEAADEAIRLAGDLQYTTWRL